MNKVKEFLTKDRKVSPIYSQLFISITCCVALLMPLMIEQAELKNANIELLNNQRVLQLQIVQMQVEQNPHTNWIPPTPEEIEILKGEVQSELKELSEYSPIRPFVRKNRRVEGYF